MIKKTVLFISFVFIVSFALYAEIESPQSVGFVLEFTKKGESTFGLYSDSSCTTSLEAINFPLIASPTESATYSDVYIGWKLYDKYLLNNSKVRIQLAHNLANINGDGYCLYDSKNGNGLNYSVSITEEENAFINVTGNENKELPASSRSCEFTIIGNSANSEVVEGSRQLVLTINPPKYENQTEAAFMAGAYSGYLIVSLITE